MDFENDHLCGSSRNNFLLSHEGRIQQGMNRQKKGKGRKAFKQKSVFRQVTPLILEQYMIDFTAYTGT